MVTVLRMSDLPRFNAAAFRRRRYQLGLSLRGVARAAAQAGHPISDRNVGALERGEQQPRPDTLLALAAAVQTEPDELLIWPTPPTTAPAPVAEPTP